jgi:hypothetical protein
MKLQLVKVSNPLKASFGQNEDRKARETRMKGFWADKANACLYPLGALLSVLVKPGQRIADLIADGKGSVTIDSVVLSTGQELPVNPPQVLSISTCVHGWGCPACHSAHGSAIYPSRGTEDASGNRVPDADGLASNKWYYNPTSKQVFVISDTCWNAYVKALGAATPKRFTVPELTPVPVKS